MAQVGDVAVKKYKLEREEEAVAKRHEQVYGCNGVTDVTYIGGETARAGAAFEREGGGGLVGRRDSEARVLSRNGVGSPREGQKGWLGRMHWRWL